MIPFDDPRRARPNFTLGMQNGEKRAWRHGSLAPLSILKDFVLEGGENNND
jgi:hypothetical protein